MRYFFIISIFLIGCNAIKKTSNTDYDLIILFGSGFKNDTVSLMINDKQVFKNKLLTSDSHRGVVKSLSVVGLRERVSLLNSDNENVLDINMPIKKKINIGFEINHKATQLTVKLGKGKIIMLNKNLSNQTISMFQTKKQISLY